MTLSTPLSLEVREAELLDGALTQFPHQGVAIHQRLEFPARGALRLGQPAVRLALEDAPHVLLSELLDVLAPLPLLLIDHLQDRLVLDRLLEPTRRYAEIGDPEGRTK